MKRILTLLALALVLLFAVASWAKEFRFENNNSVDPAAAGKVDVDHDRNGNDQLKIHVYHLPDPDKLSPPRSAYVVWVQPAGQPPEKLGQLKVNEKLEGSLSATTPYKTFDVFITAEDNLHSDAPNGSEVLRAKIVH